MPGLIMLLENLNAILSVLQSNRLRSAGVLQPSESADLGASLSGEGYES